MGAQLVLASASPRRRSLLEQAGVAFTVQPAHVDETPHPGEDPTAYALRVATAKARAVASHSGALVLGADTVVHVEATPYGKPMDARDACAMLRRLAGQWHQVTTGFALCRSGALIEQQEVTTQVRFRSLGDAEIDRYVASGEPLDKAGAYAIQGLGGALVERVVGSYSNVVGLPLAEVLAALLRHGLEPP